ncbi:MAG: tRNA epoxyqueuosine(34) reductase QueG, partial [Deltaproteobacteria bacterium]
CPWNRFETPSSEPAFAPRPDNVSPPLDELADLDEATFRARFRKSPIKRTKWAGFQRNVQIARSNVPRDE